MEAHGCMTKMGRPVKNEEYDVSLLLPKREQYAKFVRSALTLIRIDGTSCSENNGSHILKRTRKERKLKGLLRVCNANVKAIAVVRARPFRSLF